MRVPVPLLLGRPAGHLPRRRRVLPAAARSRDRARATAPFWICLLLTLLGWLPGQVYALFIVCTDSKIVASEANMVADVV